MRRRGGALDPGRIHRRLIGLFDAIGYTDVMLFPASGAYRTDTRIDCYRWTGFGRDREGVLWALQSWYTMTECARAGSITINGDGDVIPGHAGIDAEAVAVEEETVK